jgi:hypothetical protein
MERNGNKLFETINSFSMPYCAFFMLCFTCVLHGKKLGMGMDHHLLVCLAVNSYTMKINYIDANSSHCIEECELITPLLLEEDGNLEVHNCKK